MPQHLLRNRHADLLGGFKIDHELEFRWLLDGQLGARSSSEEDAQLTRLHRAFAMAILRYASDMCE